MPLDVLAQVTENKALGDGYFLTTLVAPAIASACAPGQFVMAGSTDLSELLLRRPFSICLRGGSSSAGERPASAGQTFQTLSLLYRVIGRGTAFLARLAVGETAALLGPLGHGFSTPREGETPVIVAGGVGIAAFPFLIETLLAAGRPPVLLYGGRTAADLLLLDWFRERTLALEITTDDGSLGERGLVTSLVERRLAASGRRASPRGLPAPGQQAAAGNPGAEPASRARLYVCGPHAMMRASAEIAMRHGVPCEVAIETPMACGYGVCVGCVVEMRRFEEEYLRYRRVCVDGPVFEASDVRW